MRVIDRVCEIPHEGPFCDLMWSDPEDIDTWAVSPRGAGWLFGRKVTSEFNQINGTRARRGAGAGEGGGGWGLLCTAPAGCFLPLNTHTRKHARTQTYKSTNKHAPQAWS